MFETGFPKDWSTLKKLIWLYGSGVAGGAKWVWQLLTGTAPLALQDAVAHPIHSLTQYGLCVQDGTPTPGSPVDIVCNNGKIMVSRNMCDVTEANVVVGKYINNSGVESSDTANFYYATYIPVTPGGTYTMATSSSIWYFSVMQYDSSKNFLRRTIWGATNTPVGTEKTFDVGADCAYIRFGSNMRKATISLADVLAVNWMLTQTATAQDYRPYGEIYVGGTHPGQNLVDLTAVTDDYYYDSSGVYTALANARLTDYIPVKSGQKYTIYVKAQRAGVAANVRCNLFDSAKVWKSQSTFAVNSGSEDVGVISPTEDGYLRVSANYAGTGAKADWSTLQIVRGEYTLATMPPYEPYTEVPYQTEVLTVSGPNLFDASSYTEINAYVNANTGVLTAGSPLSNTQYCAVIPCKPLTQYNITGQGTSAWGAFSSDSIGTTATAFTKGGLLTTGANDRYLIGLVRANGDSIDYRSTLAVQEAQTVSVPMLLGVGTYKDEGELISGLLTHKVGIKVLTGQETGWTKSTTRPNTYIEPNLFSDKPINRVGVCSHFIVSNDGNALNSPGYLVFGSATVSANFSAPTDLDTVQKFTAWLAAQYTAGAPVIVLYPLSTETTEQTTPHALHTTAGDNVVDVTAAVEGVTVSVEYAKVPA